MGLEFFGLWVLQGLRFGCAKSRWSERGFAPLALPQDIFEEKKGCAQLWARP